MPRTKVIGFDWGGVIFQNPGGNFNDAAAAFLGINGDEFRRAYFLHNHMINKGELTTSFEEAIDMWKAILTELDMLGRLGAFMEFVRSRPKGEVSQPMVNLITRLKQAGWKIGLLSNTSVEGAQTIRAESCFTLFDVALFSAEIGGMKPEPLVFLKLAKSLGAAVDRLVFIDDSAHSLSTAPAVGYTPVRFQTIDQLVHDLALLGIEV